ncbi:hypothetical protein AVEN_54637-1 [Araneus ventricosus]|uniref:Uncharacterized protein n=1 Tax=Araneus ventricosus TaxID=182803 RepID=A0A4Y2BN23_ARAVE|nr:hypothetical protein AVEN_54637-1 [Araneus ventricosus]
MIARFDKTGHLGVQPGRGRKSTRSDVVEDVATAIIEQSMDNVVGCSSARAVSRHLGVPYSTVRNVLRTMLHFFPYKISYNQQLLAIDMEKRLTLALTFLARVEVDATWPWQILRSDEAHFHLTPIEQSTPITVAFGTRKTLVPSKRFHFTHRKLQSGVYSQPRSFSWTFLFRRGYSQWPCDMYRDGQGVQKRA